MKNQKKLAQTRFLICILAVPIIHLLVFWVYLNLTSFKLAFQIQKDGAMVWSLDNFRALFESFTVKGSIFWVALKNTALYWVTGSILSYLLAFPVCYFFFKKIKGYKIFRFIIFLPTLISATVLVNVFKQIIGANGPVAMLLEKAGRDYIPFLSSEEWAIWTCLFYSLIFGFGTNTLVISGAMNQISDSVIEAAQLDGVNGFQELTKIIMPIIWPTFSAVFIQSIAGFFSASGPILLLTNGNYNTWTIDFWIYQQVYGNMSYNFPSAIGLFFGILGLPLALFSRWALKRIQSD